MSSGRQPPAHRASHQSTSSYASSQVVSEIPDDAQKLVHAKELITLLAHLKVMTPHDLLSESFPDKGEWNRIPRDEIKFSFHRELGDYKLKFTENQKLYNCLKRAFDTCCDGVAPVASADDFVPTKNLYCANTSSWRPRTEGLTGSPKARAPDLCLTFDAMENYSPDTFYSLATAALEFKSSVSADPGFTAIKIAKELSEKKEQKVETLSTAAGKMLVQAFEYVFAQWSERPYRYVWSITIACDVMRIWRWSASGVLVTEAIDYINDATPVYQFLQAVGKGPYSRLGLDVGRGMTFGALGSELEQVRGGVHNIIRRYGEAINQSNEHIRWIKKALESDIWSFKQPSWVPVQKEILGIGHPGTLAQIDANQSEQKITTIQAGELNLQQSDAAGTHTLYVVSHPIWRGKGVYSRGTRCYLAVYESTLHVDKIYTVDDAHMLKTSWQFASRTPEYDFFARVQARYSGPVPHLASMIAGGNIESTEQLHGQFLNKIGRTAAEQGQKPQQRRHLQWILFKQLGERISGFRSVSELLQTICDAVVAHENLYRSDILHGDISESNVLIALSANDDKVSKRRGLLIDLDMARIINQNERNLGDSDPKVSVDLCDTPSSKASDILETRSIPEATPSAEATPDTEAVPDHELKATPPDITGTLLFMSVAMKAKPRNQCWHDMESFYWLLLFVTLRHVQGVKVTINAHDFHLDDPRDREFTLKRVFDPQRRGEALNDFSDAKEIFLRNDAAFAVEKNPTFTTLLQKLFNHFNVKYTSFWNVTRLSTNLSVIETDLKLPNHKLPLSTIYLARGVQEYKQQLLDLQKATERALAKMDKVQEIAEDVSLLREDAPSTIQSELISLIQELAAKGLEYVTISRALKDVEKYVGRLRSDEDDVRFLAHKDLKETLSAAITGQKNILAIPSAPFRPKRIENAASTVQSAVSRLTTPESGSSDAAPFSISRSRGSGGMSSGERASLKRKLSPTTGESSTNQKRQKIKGSE